MSEGMKLYTYWRSSAAYRVRIALALKGLAAEPACVHLPQGEQGGGAYRAMNPQGLVPALEDGGQVLTQSLAIIEYLDETHPEPPLLPAVPAERAQVRAVAQAICCDIHPLNNLRVLNRLRTLPGMDEDGVKDWVAAWIGTGFDAVEDLLHGTAGRFCYGDRPGLADICLVPQVFNARRYSVDLSAYPIILRIDQTCRQLAPFRQAAPENQPDAQP
jgi:maleylacetoacetate isomerase